MRHNSATSRLPTLLAVWLLLAGAAPAQDLITEVVPARFRGAEELAAVLRPLIPSPGSIGGFHNQLVIKTTADNLAELREVLTSLDRAPANLLVSVRHRLNAEVSRDLASAKLALRGDAGRARLGAQHGNDAEAGAGVTVRRGALNASVELQRRTVTNQDSFTQRLRVLEGEEAFIQTGESIAVSDRQVIMGGAGALIEEGTRYEEFGSGFWARARLSGDRVTLQIYPAERRRRGDGNALLQRTSTAVSGALGRWMEIGGVNVQAEHDSFSAGGSRSTTTRQQRSTYVKVERLN